MTTRSKASVVGRAISYNHRTTDVCTVIDISGAPSPSVTSTTLTAAEPALRRRRKVRMQSETEFCLIMFVSYQLLK